LAVVVVEDLAVVPIIKGREEEGLELLMISGVPNVVPVIDVDFEWNSKMDY